MLTDDELRAYADTVFNAESPPKWAEYAPTLMARELLAARGVVRTARASVANAALVCDEDCALEAALNRYDEATR